MVNLITGDLRMINKAWNENYNSEIELSLDFIDK